MSFHDTAEDLHQEEGNILMWLLVWAELAVFGALLFGFMLQGLRNPAGFAAGKALLASRIAGFNTVVLLLSGWQAAQAVLPERSRFFRRIHFLAAGLLGLVFILLKLFEYAGEWQVAARGGSEVFWQLYTLTTGFHLAHVVFLSGLLLWFAWRPGRSGAALAVILWHVTDLVWLAIFPIIYLS